MAIPCFVFDTHILIFITNNAFCSHLFIYTSYIHSDTFRANETSFPRVTTHANRGCQCIYINGHLLYLVNKLVLIYQYIIICCYREILTIYADMCMTRRTATKSDTLLSVADPKHRIHRIHR